MSCLSGPALLLLVVATVKLPQRTWLPQQSHLGKGEGLYLIFGPTLCTPGMFGGVTLCLSCVLMSEAFFAAELMMSEICYNPKKLDRCVYVGLFVANVLRLSPRTFSGSCTTSSCVRGSGRSYVYFRGGKNTTVYDIRSAPAVGIHPV